MYTDILHELLRDVLPAQFTPEQREDLAQQVNDNDTWYENPDLFEKVIFAYEQESTINHQGQDTRKLCDAVKNTEFFSNKHLDAVSLYPTNKETGALLLTPTYLLDNLSTKEDVQEVHDLIETWTRAAQPFAYKHGEGKVPVKIYVRSAVDNNFHLTTYVITRNADNSYACNEKRYYLLDFLSTKKFLILHL